MLKSRAGATPESIGRAIGRLKIPTIKVFQLTESRLWFCEQGEPFFEVDIVRPSRVSCRVSVHCSPQWAAICTVAVAELAVVDVHHEPFIQAANGTVLVGPDAEAYWKYQRDVRPLLTARFSIHDPN